MDVQRFFTRFFAIPAVAALSACGVFGDVDVQVGGANTGGQAGDGREGRGSLFDLFENRDDPNVTLEVNKYLWSAALEVLNFLPIEAADPFSGVIVTGYGRPPGGAADYRATVHITDPALDARALKLAMERRGGGVVDADTVRAVEDAILTRARQLRIGEDNL